MITTVILFKGLKATASQILTIVMAFLVICCGITILQMSKIDPTELGLFTLVQPTQSAPAHTQEDAPSATKTEITRVEFPGATPLRRPPARRARDDPARPREHEPEVYAQAALKYLER